VNTGLVLKNIVSNWANLVISVLIAFFVSPIIVHALGKEIYGVWVIIVSLTGYFTVLDFGVNTAIVRFISKATAQKDYKGARAIFSSSTAIFSGVFLLIVTATIVFGFFLRDIFNLQNLPSDYIYLVFLIAGLDLACGLVLSVYLGTLVGLQEFGFINGTAIIINIIRSVILITLMRLGYGLLTLAIIQIITTLLKALCQYIRIRTKYNYLYFDMKTIDRSVVSKLYNYSIFSFIIAISLKVLFYTDSIVIGSKIGFAAVTFFAIPSTLLTYLQQFVWSMISVLVPVISANEGTGQQSGNARLYQVGTRYSLLVAMPVVISLFFFGDDFISIWMGPEFGEQSKSVLRLLLVGYGFSFSQMIAQGILKGISRHRVLAYILSVEAAANLGLSLALARSYGIEGVAFGTMLPLLASNMAIIAYTCRQMALPLPQYLAKGYRGAIAGIVAASLVVSFIGTTASTYSIIFLKSGLISLTFLAVAVPFGIEPEHWVLIKNYSFDRSRR
jgi:O-antigen/teichoic acid export membrane protein